MSTRKRLSAADDLAGLEPAAAAEFALCAEHLGDFAAALGFEQSTNAQTFEGRP